VCAHVPNSTCLDCPFSESNWCSVYAIRLLHFPTKQMFCVLCYLYPHSDTQWWTQTHTHTHTHTQRGMNERSGLLSTCVGRSRCLLFSRFSENPLSKYFTRVCTAWKQDVFVFTALLVTQTALPPEDLVHVRANISLVLVPLNKALSLYRL